MKNNPVFDSVEASISQGDAETAIQWLTDYLEKDGTQQEALRAVRVLAANYHAVRTKENKGILPFAEAKIEYAKTNDALLSLLEDLRADRKPAPIGTQGKKPLAGWLLAGGVVLVIAILAILWLARGSEAADSAPVQCPGFRTEGFKVLVFEFQKLSGPESKPELGIQSRIRDLTERNQVNTDVKILSASAFDGNTPDVTEATRLGSQCMADMVVWGQYENGNDSLQVDIRYAFTAPDWPPGIAMETFKNVSELKADAMKISNLDEAVFRLCTAMALHENQIDLAKKWLNKIRQPNEREKQWKETLKGQ